MKMPKNLGMLLLGVWLIAWALIAGLFGIKISFTYGPDLLSVLAIVVGVLLLLGR
jgi:hypothetical protein